MRLSDQRIERSAFHRRGWTLVVVLSAASTGLLAQTPVPNPREKDPRDEVQQLRSLVQELQMRVAQLEAQQEKRQESQPAIAPSNGALPRSADSNARAISDEDREVRDFLRDTTLNLTFDGYYAYNFNHPFGRVNLLRAYDVSSNSFSINQATMVLERAPDVSKGRRFGARIDLQYGQAAETVQGSSANELRPQVYRPIFQAYGTYVIPAGSGLTVDFGKWASALGPEGNYTKDQVNYSRSYLFNFLPFYHMGFRAAYNVSPKVSVAYWLVNGAQQTEDFNGFKSQNFEFILRPNSTLTWTSNYYLGKEGRDVFAVLNPGIPTRPTQPGLPDTGINPAPDGRLHIIDNYVSWNATKQLTLAGEFDYVINRQFSHSAPSRVTGGAAYARYQLAPKLALATRAEYLSDGGLFSGFHQALKEGTITLDYNFGSGFLTRYEWRRDFSNQPTFLTDVQGILSKHQNTATVGLIWWWGRKEGSW